LPRPKEYDWVLPVAFTPQQGDLIVEYANKHGIPYREAVRRIFNIGAAVLENGGRRIDPALAAVGS
jgi:hypothetical protein